MSETTFKSVQETYKIFTTALRLAMMSPHSEWTHLKANLCAVLMLLSFMPAFIMWCYDVTLCIKDRDLENLTRQISIGVSIAFSQFKIVLAAILRKPLKELIDQINSDYELYTFLTEDYKKLVQKNRQKIHKIEKIWLWALGLACSIFPLVACYGMANGYLNNDPRKIMLHELRVPLIDEYETPYFEVIFVYMTYTAAVVGIVFVGFDGIFFICIFHICLKLDIVMYRLASLFDEDDLTVVKRNVKEVIEQHCDTFRFIDKIQKTYSVWLLFVFILTVIEICVSLIQIIAATGKDMDSRYVIFLMTNILHIYVPCYLSANVSHAADQVSVAAYCSGWERVKDNGVRKSIAFLMTRSQCPLYIKAMDMIVFDMHLFIFVLHKSYSVFTLLRPKT